MRDKLRTGSRGMAAGAVSLAALLALATTGSGALPQDSGAAGTYQKLLKLRTTASAMHTTAHPDDEHGGVLAQLSRGVGARLRKLFSFTDYTPLDEVVIQGLEGEPVSWNLGGSYRVDFLLESGGGSEVVRLRNFVLSRVRRDEKGKETAHDVARTSINLRMKEPFVLGVGREEGGSAALFLVLSAAPVGAGPGIGGLR